MLYGSALCFCARTHARTRRFSPFDAMPACLLPAQRSPLRSSSRIRARSRSLAVVRIWTMQQAPARHALFTRSCRRTTTIARTRAAILPVPRGAPASPPRHHRAHPHNRRRLVHAGAWFGSVSRLCFQNHIWPAVCNVDGSLPSSSLRRFSAAHCEESLATQHPSPVHTRTPLSQTTLLPHGTHVQVLPA